MEHDINPDGTRNGAYRPYIFGEDRVWNDSLYDPFRSVNFGLYSDWESNCFDQHNCFDRLAPISYQQNVQNYSNLVALGNGSRCHQSKRILQDQAPFYKVYASSQPTHVPKTARKGELSYNYKRLYATYT